jgi:hypothetical protein
MRFRTRIGATAAATLLMVFGIGGQAQAQAAQPGDSSTPTTPTTVVTVVVEAPTPSEVVRVTSESATETALQPPPPPDVTLTEQGSGVVGSPSCAADSLSVFVEVPPQSVDYKLTTIAHPASDPIAAPIPAGRYSLTQGSFDDVHPDQYDQPNEAWYAVFHAADGTVIGTTSLTPDLLSTDVTQAWAGETLQLAGNATSVVYHHAPGGEGPDSVYPNCLKLTPIVSPKEPEPKQPDPQKPGPGGQEPEQPAPPTPQPPDPVTVQPEPVFAIPVIQVLPDPAVAVAVPAPVAAAAPVPPTTTPEPAPAPAPAIPTITPVVQSDNVVPEVVPP